MEDIGVIARANYAKQTVEVEVDVEKVSDEKIIYAIQSEGYGCTIG